MTNENRKNIAHDEYAICRVYDKVRNGKYKSFSPHFFDLNDRYKRIKYLIRYYVEEILKITPEEALNTVTLKDLEDAKLKCILKYLKQYKPDEYMNDEEYIKHIFYFAYPSLIKPKSKDLILLCYKEVLSGKRKRFPKNYFKTVNGEKRAKICFDYLVDDVLKINRKDIPDTFLRSSKKGLALLKKYKLGILVQILYYSLSDMIKNLYPELDISEYLDEKEE